MLQRSRLSLPAEIYPVDPWRIVEKEFNPRFIDQTESIFTVSNGTIGMRGCPEEGTPVEENGTYVNGFFEVWPIVYGERAYGFAREGQTIVNVPDAKVVHLRVDGETFALPLAKCLHCCERTLDMRAGTLDREVVWETQTGKRVRIKSRRLVSYEHRHLAALSYEVTVLNGEAEVELSSEVRHDHGRRLRSGDPRLHHFSGRRVLLPLGYTWRDWRVTLAHRTERSRLTLVCGIDHRIESAVPVQAGTECSPEACRVIFTWQARRGEPLRMIKFMAWQTSTEAEVAEIRGWVEQSLDEGMAAGFGRLVAGQARMLEEFWRRSDVRIEDEPRETAAGLDDPPGDLQQALRFNLFQIFQASCRTGDLGIPAKGLTGQAYDGNYFWDTEAYVLPFLIHTHPGRARKLLDFRYRMLDKARQRAREVGEQGALFPWRTIDGDEASAYYAAGTAQYHINGDIMYALQKYVEVTGDQKYLFERGAEMLAETARMWYGLGFFSERRGGRFCIHGVTGPDEYTTVVDNNFYTNLMAQNNLRYAAATHERMRQQQPEAWQALAHKIKLRPEEVADWAQAAQSMYLPYDPALGIHPQDDTFLDKQVWDFAHTPEDHYPLLLHYHPLKIYRYQVLKQADVALAMVLLGDQFTHEQKRRNFEYYDPLTTSDSSLSVSIQSILALETGHWETALEYARYSILMDLGNIEGNVRDGCHIASLGGSWMLCVYGFAGLREYSGNLWFRPWLPRGIRGLHFPLTVRGRLLEVHLNQQTATYRLLEGDPLTFRHCREDMTLARGESVTAAILAPELCVEAEGGGAANG